MVDVNTQEPSQKHMKLTPSVVFGRVCPRPNAKFSTQKSLVLKITEANRRNRVPVEEERTKSII